MVPIQVIRWYRMQCYGGTDSCATVVPIRRYCHYQQEMLENITKALTGRSQVTFYDQNGKKMKVGNSVVVMEEDMVMVKTASTERKRMTDQEFSISG